MSPRAMWKGRLRIGDSTRAGGRRKQGSDVSIPFKLYAAVQDRGTHFRLLHREDLAPVQQQMVDPETEEVVPAEEIRRAAPDELGNLILLDDAELAEIDPEPSRDVLVSAFVPTSAIPHGYFDRSYYLAPDGDDHLHAALVAALEAEQAAGIAHWVMRKRDYNGALIPRAGMLVLVTLRAADEVLVIPAIEPDRRAAPSKKELKLARQLVEALADSFEPERYADRYREAVAELAAKKAQGIEIELPPPERPAAPTEDLRSTLEESLASLRKAG